MALKFLNYTYPSLLILFRFILLIIGVILYDVDYCHYCNYIAHIPYFTYFCGVSKPIATGVTTSSFHSFRSCEDDILLGADEYSPLLNVEVVVQAEWCLRVM
jgi:hypothetical protein